MNDKTDFKSRSSWLTKHDRKRNPNHKRRVRPRPKAEDGPKGRDGMLMLLVPGCINGVAVLVRSGRSKHNSLDAEQTLAAQRYQSAQRCIWEAYLHARNRSTISQSSRNQISTAT
jgi:hypothetical protein